MAGRAGRKGLDAEGEAIVMCEPKEVGLVQRLLTAPLTPVASQLVPLPPSSGAGGGAHAPPTREPLSVDLQCALVHRSDANGLTRAVLDAVACGLVQNQVQLAEFSANTLLVKQVCASGRGVAADRGTCSARRLVWAATTEMLLVCVCGRRIHG
jgi:hypothetical protein